MKSKYVVGHLTLFLVLYHAVALSYNIMVGSEPSPELFICFFFGAFGLGAQFFSVVNRLLLKMTLMPSRLDLENIGIE